MDNFKPETETFEWVLIFFMDVYGNGGFFKKKRTERIFYENIS